ncbi:hypothetical protein SDRG_05034 [Saprolegnia diclina VS20]|uniref:Uncharacterized protein n=1 Tax=Saprolegnia diclina (strain VS20) TaxID=1156394 RepID=T0QRV8_SAPDV|nr:hypothetical protein SDRG_05034 [Saprolegnia diclina VS20]EQC37431.1 hypothetical protein SDRG_05034 [Saprolegnia diclina VS20]|eukprot:XP_008608951.1 hypothetical protein SDRG_05034 [Saprolegnia diclina VS20]
MAVYYSIAVARAGEIVSRSLVKAETDTTLRSLFGMYEGGKHAIGFMDPAVKAGTRTAVFEQHDATMDLVDLDMPIRLVREICGDVTKFLFQAAPAIVPAPALLPPPSAPVVAATPQPVPTAPKPKPVAATRGRKPRKAVVVDSFLRASDLNRIGDVTAKAPTKQPASRYRAPAPRIAEGRTACTTAVLPDASTSALARATVVHQKHAMTPLNKNALGRILEAVKANKPSSRAVSPPKAPRTRPHYFNVAPPYDEDDDNDDNDSDASVADDDDDDDAIEVVQAPVTKRASRRLAPSSLASAEPPRRELRIPQVVMTSMPRSRTQRLPARRAALRKSTSALTEMVLSADGAVVTGNVLGRSSDVDASPRRPPPRRPTRRTSASQSPEKVLPLRTSTRNKSIVEISSDDEACSVPSPSSTTRLSLSTGTPTKRPDTDMTTASPASHREAATPTKQPSPLQPQTPPPVDVAEANATPTLPDVPDVTTAKAGPTGTPEMARKKRLLSLDDTVEEHVHDVSPPAKRRLSSFGDVPSSPATRHVSSSNDAESSSNTADENTMTEPRSVIEDELATLLHEASAVELVQLREANPNDQANFLGEELNEVKRHVQLQKTSAGLYQVAFTKASHADIAPHENPNVVLTNLFMSHDDDWSRVATLVSLGRVLRAAP